MPGNLLLCQSTFHNPLRCCHYNTSRTERGWFLSIFLKVFRYVCLRVSLSCCVEKEGPLCRIITAQEATLLWICVSIRHTDPRICCGIPGSNSHYRALQEKLPYRQNIEIARRVFHHKFHHTRFRRLHPSVCLLPTHTFRFPLSFLTPSRLYLDFSHPFILYFYVLIGFTQQARKLEFIGGWNTLPPLRSLSKECTYKFQFFALLTQINKHFPLYMGNC